MENSYFKVFIPPVNAVGAATTKTFHSREAAEKFLKDEGAESSGRIELVDEQGKIIE